MSSMQSPVTPQSPNPEKYLIAFVIQGDDVFKITADNIIHTTGTASGPAFDAIAKLKAAAALLELTNRHKERPTELRQMARELANEGMKMMARASSAIRPAPEPEVAEVNAEPAQLEPPPPAPTQPAVTPAAVFQPETEKSHNAEPVPVRTATQLPLGPVPVPPSEDRSAEPAILPTAGKIALITH